MKISFLHFDIRYGVIYLLAPLFFVFGCSSDETRPMIEDDPVVVVEEEPERLTFEELDYMTRLLAVEEELQGLWPDFKNIRECTTFLITGEGQGILMNPPDNYLAVSRPILNEIDDYEEVPLFRNDILYDFARAELPGGAFYSFTNYNGLPLFVYDMTYWPTAPNFYFDYKNRNGQFHVSVFYHELFHQYSVFKNYYRFLGENRIFDLQGYPITAETLPLQLLLFDVMIDAYHAETMAEKTAILQYYVSINHQLNAIDPTNNNLIKAHGFYQEKVEGTARYIEVFGTLNSLDNNTIDDPTHGYKDFADNITSSGGVTSVYGFRMFYHIGGGVTHLLQELGFENLDQAYMVPTNTPFSLSESFLNMDTATQENALETAKTLYNWDALVERAEYLLSL
ncbi:MAG: hypothetical protein AAF489_14835 [Bacteroidota bacterium]